METFDTIIGQNSKLQGSLNNQGPIQINGTVEGEVQSGAAIIVGSSAVVKGPVKAKLVDISGEVHGTVEAEERVEIQPKGKLYGDCITKNFVIKLGATFVGKSTMSGEDTKADVKEDRTDE